MIIRMMATAMLTAALCVGAASPAFAVSIYTNGDEWGLWTKPHTVTLSCSPDDRLVSYKVLHGREHIRRTKVSRTGVSFTLKGGDPEKYDSAMSAVVRCLDR